MLFREFLTGCVDRWMTEPQYFHGFAIPVIALALGWADDFPEDWGTWVEIGLRNCCAPS